MTPQATDTDTRTATPASNGHEELLIDTAGMSPEQRAAMEVAEIARGAADSRDSFAGRLLSGRYEPERLRPFPEQDAADRAVGDDLVARVTKLMSTMDAEEVDATRTIPAEILDGLREIGVLKMKVPAEYGGLGVSQVNYNRVIQAIASYCSSTAVLVSAHQSIGVPQPLKMFGTDEQKARFLPRIADGALTAFALTEPDVGSDPAQLATTAVPTDDGRHYILNGEKLWTTNGPVAQLLVVMAKTPSKVYRGRERRQITAFIVDTDTPGVENVHRCDFLGLRAIQNGVLRFTDVRVPAENILWGPGMGLKLALQTLNTGRLTLPAACAGAAKQCLSIMRSWGNERVQWGRPVGRHEAGMTKIAYVASTTFAMEAVAWLTSHWADEQRDIRIEAAMAKLFCSEACWSVVDTALQLRGGRGYERADSLRARGEMPYPLERMLRDCRINTIIEGTSDIMRLFLAREALDPHLKLAAGVIKPGAELGERLKAGLGALRHYATWYPRQILGGRNPLRHRAEGALARHHRFIDRTSHRLAASMLHAMARHQAGLEKRQELLGRMMDIGTELFAMAATCAYARAATVVKRSGDEGETLADLFCRQARARIAEHFRAMRSRDGRAGNALAKRVLTGGYRWLEDGIIPCVAPNGSARSEPKATHEGHRNGTG
ncbi:MAG: acyl-CoA dehydrogenase family protein [Planctomycetota bacterium]|jgi:alkylation response protein AidB-like acyl-CoA dehydrogenase